MAAPTVGSSEASGASGSLTEVELGSARQLADGSFAKIVNPGGIWTAKVLTGSGNTVVKSGAGQLHAVIVGTATGNLTLYDNTAASGTKILDTFALVAGVTTLDVSFGTGLTATLSGAGVVTVTFN